MFTRITRTAALAMLSMGATLFANGSLIKADVTPGPGGSGYLLADDGPGLGGGYVADDDGPGLGGGYADTGPGPGGSAGY